MFPSAFQGSPKHKNSKNREKDGSPSCWTCTQDNKGRELEEMGGAAKPRAQGRSHKVANIGEPNFCYYYALRTSYILGLDWHEASTITLVASCLHMWARACRLRVLSSLYTWGDFASKHCFGCCWMEIDMTRSVVCQKHCFSCLQVGRDSTRSDTMFKALLLIYGRDLKHKVILYDELH